MVEFHQEVSATKEAAPSSFKIIIYIHFLCKIDMFKNQFYLGLDNREIPQWEDCNKQTWHYTYGPNIQLNFNKKYKNIF